MPPALSATLDLDHADPLSVRSVAGWLAELAPVEAGALAPALEALLTAAAAARREGRVTLSVQVEAGEVFVALGAVGVTLPEDLGAPGLQRRPDRGALSFSLAPASA